MNDDDHALLDGVLAGDPRAQRRFVAQFHRPIRQTIAATWAQRGARLGEADLDDALQQVFVALFNRDGQVLRQWKGEASLRGYLRGIARKLAMRLLSRIARDGGRFRLILDAPVGGVETEDRPTLLEAVSDSTGADTLDAEQWLQLRQERERLRAAILAQLTERGRALYQWIYVEELDVDVVAQRAEMTPNNVYQWRNRIARVAEKVLHEAGYGLGALLLLISAWGAAAPQKVQPTYKIVPVDRHLEVIGPILGAQTMRESR